MPTLTDNRSCDVARIGGDNLHADVGLVWRGDGLRTNEDNQASVLRHPLPLRVGIGGMLHPPCPAYGEFVVSPVHTATRSIH